MRCLFAVKDDLHDYAAAVLARMQEHLARRPLAVQTFAGFDCAVLHRVGNMQAELVQGKPGEVIHMHTHPGVDSIELYVAGHFTLKVGERLIPRPIKGAGVRIAQDAPHCGKVGEEGVAFLSCQRWATPPSFIAMSWRGRALSDEHARMIDHLEAVA